MVTVPVAIAATPTCLQLFGTDNTHTSAWGSSPAHRAGCPTITFTSAPRRRGIRSPTHCLSTPNYRNDIGQPHGPISLAALSHSLLINSSLEPNPQPLTELQHR